MHTVYEKHPHHKSSPNNGNEIDHCDSGGAQIYYYVIRDGTLCFS
jgi:hypothetical protein